MILAGLAVILWPRNRRFRPNPGHRMAPNDVLLILWPVDGDRTETRQE